MDPATRQGRWSALSCAFSLLLLAGCGPDQFDWRLRFVSPEVASRAVAIRATVTRGGCGGVVLYDETFSVSGAPDRDPPDLDDGVYGLAAVATDLSCGSVAEGCTTIQIPLKGTREAIVQLFTTGTIPQCDPSECVLGSCLGRDAGVDSGPVGCASDLQCNDGVACTADRCLGGTCQFFADASQCDDGQVCTDERCDPVAGCLTTFNVNGCDDGSFCNGIDRCTSGTCLPIGATVCFPPMTCDERLKACVGCTGGAEFCANGVDDDCDGASDCADVDCAGSTCASGAICSDGVCCAPSGESCVDGVDNDCDSLADCADPQCNGVACGSGRVCMSGSCGCASGSTERCSDHVDNNCDGVIDCEDVACDGMTCSDGMVCSGGTCACASASEVCNDGLDNDCDGNRDCADSGCALSPLCDGGCSPSCNVTQYCALSVCSGVGTCVTRPVSCGGASTPVCACSGVTYDNACLARRNGGVDVRHAGACP